MKVQFRLLSTEPIDLKERSKLFGNVVADYVYVQSSTTHPEQPMPFPVGGDVPYDGFLEWSDAVGRALCSLSVNTYRGNEVVATWGIDDIE